ncbi:hypothetical protein ACFVYD_11175 [Streptomyces sp. NPDC058301]|uniref:hypothetical protein n=1 Tax=Streptomyces sp. NPDC058301 TaxID=3346436 RepID=UPI0036E68E09
MSVQQYDEIGEAFEGFKSLPLMRYGDAPRREVYEECLRAAGFSAVEWVPLQVSDAGIREFGADFWADLVANPPLELLR